VLWVFGGMGGGVHGDVSYELLWRHKSILDRYIILLIDF